MKLNKNVLLILTSIATAAITMFVDDKRYEDIAEQAAEKAVKKMQKEEPKALPQRNRAERRLASRKGH